MAAQMVAAPVTTPTASSTWGPLAHPVRTQPLTATDPWRDKTSFWFWDAERRIYGTFCASTSPHVGGQARLRVAMPADAAELVEPLEPGTLGSSAIRFDLEESLTVDGEGLAAALEVVPRHARADFMAGWVIPPLVPGEPLHRWQQGATVQGWVRVGERHTPVSGLGLRDRSWGYCNVDDHVLEQVAVVAGFNSFTLTAKKFRGGDDAVRTEGVPAPRGTFDRGGLHDRQSRWARPVRLRPASP
jgi:hypothetical protein